MSKKNNTAPKAQAQQNPQVQVQAQAQQNPQVQAQTTQIPKAHKQTQAQIIIDDLLASKDDLLANLQSPEFSGLSPENIEKKFLEELEEINFSEFSSEEKGKFKMAFQQLENYCIPLISGDCRKLARRFFQSIDDVLESQAAYKHEFFFNRKNTDRPVSDPIEEEEIASPEDLNYVADLVFSSIEDIQNKFGISESADPKSISGLTSFIKKEMIKNLGNKIDELKKMSPEQKMIYVKFIDQLIVFCEENAKNEFSRKSIRLIFDPIIKAIGDDLHTPVSKIPQTQTPAPTITPASVSTSTAATEPIYPVIDDEDFGLPEIFYPYISVWNYVRVGMFEHAILALNVLKSQHPEKKVANALVWVMQQMKIDALTRKAFINTVIDKKVFGDKISREISITV